MNKAWMGVLLASLALGVTAAPKKAPPPAKPVVIEGSVSRVVTPRRSRSLRRMLPLRGTR